MRATNIREVIAALDTIIGECIDQHNRAGYFAALYRKVTVAVSNKIAEGYFEDNERMELLDVLFANFYLDAYYQHQQGQPCVASWQLAFKETSHWQPMILQHLLAGMNAHIGLDLGVATALVSKGKPILLIKEDFDKINFLLAAMVAEVKSSLFDIWPLSKFIVKFNTAKLENDVAGFSMTIARDAAWEVALACDVEIKNGNDAQYLAMRDEEVAVFAKKLFHFPRWIQLLLFLSRVFEWGSIAKKIGRLAR